MIQAINANHDCKNLWLRNCTFQEDCFSLLSVNSSIGFIWLDEMMIDDSIASAFSRMQFLDVLYMSRVEVSVANMKKIIENNNIQQIRAFSVYDQSVNDYLRSQSKVDTSVFLLVE
jgi:hypothetical protein